MKRFKAYFLILIAKFYTVISKYHVDRARAYHDKVDCHLNKARTYHDRAEKILE